MVTAWTLWLHMNEIYFTISTWNEQLVIQRIQRKRYMWLRDSYPASSINFNHWLQQPLIYAEELYLIGIDALGSNK